MAPDPKTQLRTALHGSSVPMPAVRKLRVYAFDPQASGDLETATINDTTISIAWEEPWERPVSPGPCGEYLEVIDHDPASGLFYEPVDLNDPLLLAQNGLAPSEGRPQFHQQMVFAVAMKTIKQFERALGRSVYWTREQLPADEPESEILGERERGTLTRLRIYPHAIREENAYYSPTKTSLLFGYFQPTETASGDRWVFTCLSQDIIAHETTHALLHGMHRRSIQSSNLDTFAFHEGFADIVALLQHFTMTDVLQHQIGHWRGDLRKSSLLTGLARQFGQAIGRRNGALREALDLIERQREAEALPLGAERDKALKALQLSDSVREPHARGGFLVAAVFDAFVTIYERRVADLFRLAFGTSRPNGTELPPDLVRRLASEASKTADHVLRMCVRALDYIPPVDMTFGEYLRAIITADQDLVPEDPLRYRVGFAQAFRKCGILAPGSLSMAPDSLLWEAPDPSELPEWSAAAGFDRPYNRLFADLLPRLHLSPNYGPDGTFFDDKLSLREKNVRLIEGNRKIVWDWLNEPGDNDEVWESLLGVELLAADHPGRSADRPPLRSVRWKPLGDHLPAVPVLQVYSTRVARRAGPDGQELNQLVIQVVQKRKAFFDVKRQEKADTEGLEDSPDFWFRGGATLLIDLRDGQLRYAIRKRIRDEDRLAKERDFHLRRRDPTALELYGEPTEDGPAPEPFAMIHRS